MDRSFRLIFFFFVHDFLISRSWDSLFTNLSTANWFLFSLYKLSEKEKSNKLLQNFLKWTGRAAKVTKKAGNILVYHDLKTLYNYTKVLLTSYIFLEVKLQK